MLDLNTKGPAGFEETAISNDYLPLISISTYHQTGCQKTYIDNIIPNHCIQDTLSSRARLA